MAKVALERATAWLRLQRPACGPTMTLGIGGPPESEVPGIYARARELIRAILRQRQM